MRAQVSNEPVRLTWWAWPTFAFLVATTLVAINGGNAVYQALLFAPGLGCLAAACSSSKLRLDQQWGLWCIVTGLATILLLLLVPVPA